MNIVLNLTGSVYFRGSTFPFTGEDCTVVEATSLTCPSPAIDTSTITGYTVPTGKY